MANFSRIPPQLGVTCPVQPWRPPWLNDHPRLWKAGTLDRARLHSDAVALSRQPDFDAVARRFACLWLDTQVAHPSLRAVFRNTARYLLLVNSVVMHHRRDPADSRSGITPGRLLAFFERDLHGTLQTSGSQVKAMLAHAKLHGLLQPVPDPGDLRYRPLVPSPMLIEILRDWVRAFLRAAEGIADLPLPAAPAIMVAAPGMVGEVFSYRTAALTEDGFILWRDIGALQWVIKRDNGYRVFLHMVAAMQPQPDGTAIIPLTAAELARRSGATRGTVRNLLLDAVAQGWFDTGAPKTEGWRLRPADLEVVRYWIALEILWMHGLARAAYESAVPAADRGVVSQPGAIEVRRPE